MRLGSGEKLGAKSDLWISRGRKWVFRTDTSSSSAVKVEGPR